MSWSVSGVGKAKPLAAKLAAQLANIKCSEPEESIKNNAASAITMALATYPENYVVKVVASGNQHVPSPGDKPDEKVNNLSVVIEVVYGFVE
jgi:hypothetical protein